MFEKNTSYVQIIHSEFNKAKMIVFHTKDLDFTVYEFL